MTQSAYSDAPWWASAVFFQVYPRSFADGNGDGTGDLVGIRERLDHLVELGVDALWISPFYTSPMADGGYDVADPCDVDPSFGTLADFDDLLAAAHERGVRLTVDIVPNHFSDQHPWFQAVLQGDENTPERELFVIRAGRGADGSEPPNNWPSVFGGPAWHRLPDGAWYLHLFAPEQPDLNWANPAIADEFERIMRFWLDRGVDGFRVDVAHSMAKEPGLPDLDPDAIPVGGGMTDIRDLRWDRDEVHDIHRRFRRTLDSYDGDRMAVGEAWVPDPERLALYVRADELNLTFNFQLVQAEWEAAAYRTAIEDSLSAMSVVGAPCTWVLSNHDVDRVATRYGGGPSGVLRARAAALVQLSLPGAVYLYQGDELGLENVELPDAVLQDPTWERSGHTDRGRDGERVPIPWSGTAPPYGFGTAPETWLPMPEGWGGVTVEAEAVDPHSTLALYRAATALRRSVGDLRTTALEWIDAPTGCLSYRRGEVTVLVNVSADPVPLPAGELLLASGPVESTVPADTTVWVRG